MSSARRKAPVRRLIGAMVLIFLVLGLLLGVANWATARSSLLSVTFKGTKGDSSKVYLTIASTPGERRKGLMFVRSLATDRGMLFVFPEEREQGFWMKNTFISLDMIFVTKDWKIAGIIHETLPLTTERQSVKKPSMYVIELKGGTAETLGIKEGDSVQVDGPVPLGLPEDTHRN